MTTEGVYIIITLSVKWISTYLFTVKSTLVKGRCFMTALKKPLCSILAFILVFVFVAAAPISVFAEEGEIVISQKEIELNKEANDEYEYVKVDSDSAVQLVKYIGSETKVKIPTRIDSLSVITVGDGCFEGNETIESVRFNSEITSVGANAFKGCTALKEIKATESITSLGESAFEGCTSLNDIEFPETVVEVPARCFADCTALAEIKAHKNLKGCAPDAFVNTPYENNAEDGALSFGRILYSHKGELSEVNIPKGVSIIEDYAFLGDKALEVVTFGPDVEEIGLYAFQNCVNLKTVNCDDALGIINAGAFKGCSALEGIDLSETTTATIGYEAFSGCSSLKVAKTAETMSDIGDYAFADTKIETIDLGKNISGIGANSFKGVSTLKSINAVSNNKEFSTVDGVLYNKSGTALVTFPAGITGEFQLPAGVEVIRECAFANSAISKVIVAEDAALNTIEPKAFENSAIESIVIPANVKKIPANAFKNAQKLASVTFNEGLVYIGASAFEGCSALESVKLPETVHDIANGAFRNAGLKSLNTGDGLAKIDSEAFAGNKKLTDLYLGKNVEKLGDGAFKDCAKLLAVNLPASMKSFSGNAFSGCKALDKITVDAENKAFKSVGSAVYSADGKTLVIAGAKGTASLIVADGTEKIAADAFETAKGVTAISVPASLATVEDNALDVTKWYEAAKGAVYLGRILYKVKGDMPALAITDGTVAIADNAVSNASVVSVAIPASVIVIGDNAFKGSSVESLSIPAGVKEIGTAAFADMKKLSAVALGDTVELIGSAAFKNCVALAEIKLPASVKNVPADAFAGCAKLAKVDLGAVETIGKYAFSGCSALKELALPAALVELDPMSFIGCSALEKFAVAEGNEAYKAVEGVVLSANEEGEFDTIALYPVGKQGEYAVAEGIKNIAEKAFYDCDGLTAITFVDGFENIGAEAFFDCDAIKTVNMPESARDIGDHAFASCDELREFIVNTNLTVYADNAFEGCYYFNYDAVTINVEDSSGALIGGIALVFVVIGLVWYLSFKKKQKKIQKEILEKNAKLEAAKAAQNK